MENVKSISRKFNLHQSGEIMGCSLFLKPGGESSGKGIVRYERKFAGFYLKFLASEKIFSSSVLCRCDFLSCVGGKLFSSVPNNVNKGCCSSGDMVRRCNNFERL